jgi:hypothetical protein
MKDHGWTPSKNFVQAAPIANNKPSRRYMEAHDYRTPINTAWDTATNKVMGVAKRYLLQTEDDKSRWNDIHANLGYAAKTLAKQPRERKLDQIQNLGALDIILTFFEEKGR